MQSKAMCSTPSDSNPGNHSWHRAVKVRHRTLKLRHRAVKVRQIFWRTLCIVHLFASPENDDRPATISDSYAEMSDSDSEKVDNPPHMFKDISQMLANPGQIVDNQIPSALPVYSVQHLFLALTTSWSTPEMIRS